MAFKMKGMNHGEGTGSAYPKNSEVKYKALEGGIQPGEYFGQFPKLIGSKIKNLFSKSSPKKNVGYTKEGPKSAAFQKKSNKQRMFNNEVDELKRAWKSIKDPNSNRAKSLLDRAKKIGLTLRGHGSGPGGLNVDEVD